LITTRPAQPGRILRTAPHPERDDRPEHLPADAVATRSNPLAFVFFLLLNLVLFVRPEELLPSLGELHLYEILILASLLTALPTVLRQLTPASLGFRPMAVCVLGILAVIVISGIVRLQFHQAYDGAVYFVKVVIYFLLLGANLSTSARLRGFLVWLVGCILLVASLSLLHFHGVIQLPTLAPVLQLGEIDPATGERVTSQRLQATGIYSDPNDFSMILLVCMGICVYGALRPGARLRRLLWLAPFAVFAYALFRTQSRGGFLALMAGTLVLLRARFTWKKTLLIGSLVVPVLVFAFAGRQTDIDLDNGDDTFQARVRLWSEGLQLFKTSPVFGIGKDQFNEEVGMVAHNSYVHTFVELGFVGGTLFIGTLYCAMAPLVLLGRPGAPPIADPELARLRPYLLAILTAYAAGMMSLSRPYIPPTYALMGFAGAFQAVVAGNRVLPGTALNGQLVRRVVMTSVIVFVFLYVFTRIFLRLSGGG
jgi:O-antigen ligase